MSKCSHTYPPLNVLKPVADNVWIVDGPAIRFGFSWPKLSFPTRMTIVRLSNGALFVHSPTPLTEDLRAAVESLGPVSHIIGPNRIHYWWIPEWRAAFPQAEIWLAPNIREQAGKRIDFPANEFAVETGYAWDDEIETIIAPGSYMSEVDFFHKPSRTLVLTDLIENFEPKKVGPWPLHWLYRLGGVLDPHGSMPRDMRMTYRDNKPELRRAVERMIELEPERVILAHGRWYPSDGAGELKRAFSWLL
ncbi:DUF4336 domain-containing protein [Breoghania sp.]|uniref:DUF4336 domain-containing protein n=1 Tax=Breoghania sp. TaxID=2065378 RepID=UPI002AAB0A09|nr:DUF4336 domain-containing protein [Breoghania sp.]